MDQIFKDIEGVLRDLDRAKILEKENASKARKIVDGAITRLQEISEALGDMEELPKSDGMFSGLFKNSGTSL